MHHLGRVQLDVEPILSKQTQFMEFEKLLNDAEMV